MGDCISILNFYFEGKNEEICPVAVVFDVQSDRDICIATALLLAFRIRR